MGRLADTSGDVHIAVHYVVPHPVQGVPIALVSGVGGHVGHAAVQVHGTHGVAGDFGHLPHRDLVLVIVRGPHALVPIGAVTVAALVQEPVGKIQVFLFTGGLVQFHQGQFDFLMAWHPVTFTGAEDRHHMVGHTDAHVQQLALAGNLVIGHTRLDHMSGAVHLVPVHILPAVLQSGEGVEGVDVAVGLLGRGELVNPLVALGFQHRIRMVLQGIGHPLQGLVHVGVVKEDARVLSAALGGVLVVADAVGLVLDLIDAHGQGHVLVGLQPRRPEAILNLHLGERNRCNEFQAFFLLLGAARQQRHRHADQREMQSIHIHIHFT